MDERNTSKTCSRPGCREGRCSDSWLVVPARKGRRRRAVRVVVRCDMCRMVYKRDQNAARTIWRRAVE
jgi:transposase